MSHFGWSPGLWGVAGRVAGLESQPGDALPEGPLMEPGPLYALPWRRSCAFSPYAHSKEQQGQSSKSKKQQGQSSKNPKDGQERVPVWGGIGVCWKRRWYWRENWLRTSIKAPLWWPYMWDSKRDTDVKNRLFGLCGRRQGWDGWFERIALKHVYYHLWNRSPVLVRRMRQCAQGWCTGMTLRDGMGMEVGRGFRMGDTCTPVAD